jgi:hypothetical protein
MGRPFRLAMFPSAGQIDFAKPITQRLKPLFERLWAARLKPCLIRNDMIPNTKSSVAPEAKQMCPDTKPCLG